MSLNFEFIIALHVVEKYMSYTESLTRALQARALDIVQAVQHIGILKQALTDAWSEVEQQFNCLFLNASKPCVSKHGVLDLLLGGVPDKLLEKTTLAVQKNIIADLYSNSLLRSFKI